MVQVWIVRQVDYEEQEPVAVFTDGLKAMDDAQRRTDAPENDGPFSYGYDVVGPFELDPS
jgi:hypothetical protein